MSGAEDRNAVRALKHQATSHVGRESGREPARTVLKWLSRGRLGRRYGWPAVPKLGTLWQDTVSAVRIGWRQRAAYLDSEQVFAVDYQICRRCELAWVEQPYTIPEYQRCGLAAAGLAALRTENPGLEWHTLGEHFRDSKPFWKTVGTGVPGGYQQREMCLHRNSGG